MSQYISVHRSTQQLGAEITKLATTYTVLYSQLSNNIWRLNCYSGSH